MAGAVVAAVTRANAPGRAEESIQLRVLTLAAVMTASLAVALAGAAPWPDAIAALALLPLGAWVSYERRGKRNLGLKTALALAAVVALWRFLGSLGFTGSIDEARVPLAQLFLAVQIIHGFDLPARRDLGFTVASSLTLVALAAVSSTLPVVPLLIAWAALTAGALAAMQRSAAYEAAEQLCDRQPIQIIAPDGPMTPPEWGPGQDWRRTLRASLPGMRAAVTILLVGGLVFLLLPQSQSTRAFSLPVRGLPTPALGDSRVTNPGLPYSGRAGGGDFNPDAYFGLAEHLDARTVGELSDAVVMRVRADRPRPWRGMVFDTYEGGVWTRSSADIDDSELIVGIPAVLTPRHQAAATVDVVQTYELLADTPNLVFTAANPIAVYSATGSVRQWSDGTITTAGLQEAGTVYSVVSHVSDASPSSLAAAGAWTEAGGQLAPSEQERYLQLSEDLPQRVRDLARELAVDHPSPYLVAVAVESWLGENTEYVLNARPAPAGSDVVDHFLFASRQGWCEPIASSMVVLLRANGIPARLATGFMPGARHPLTGWHTVRMNNAHAWVEAWIPGHGWITFDPTGAVPLGEEPASVRIPIVDLLRAAGRAVADAAPAGARDSIAEAISSIRERPAASAAMGAAALAIALLALRAARRRPAPASGLFDRLVALLSAQGVPHRAWQTPREYVALARLQRPHLPRAALATLLDWEEARRYGDGAAGPAEAEADAALGTVADALSRPPADGGFALSGRTERDRAGAV